MDVAAACVVESDALNDWEHAYSAAELIFEHWLTWVTAACVITVFSVQVCSVSAAGLLCAVLINEKAGSFLVI